MKRKTQNIILIVLLAVFCLCILAACNNQTADYYTYSEENLGAVGKLVRWMHGWVGNYGWTVVVFTVFLKILTSPLDIWQRVSSRKSTLKMQRMQPIIAEIDKRYGANSQRANEEKQKLYKKQGFSAFAMCLPLIITMVIFFVMFGGLNKYSTYSSVTNLQNLSGTYFDEYYKQVMADEDIDSEIIATFHDTIAAALDKDAVGFGQNEHFLRDNYTKTNVNAYSAAINNYLRTTLDKVDRTICSRYDQAALEEVSKYYEENHESWLWIHNVWQPDTWKPIMAQYSDVVGSGKTISEFPGGENHYNAIRDAVVKTGGYGKDGKWNGLMLLPVLSIALSFLSIFLSQRMDRRVRKGEEQAAAQNPQQAANNTMMMIIMPLMMAFFGFMYTGAFAIYMVCNYLLSLLSTLALAYPVEKMVQKSLAKAEMKEKSNKASYMR